MSENKSIDKSNKTKGTQGGVIDLTASDEESGDSYKSDSFIDDGTTHSGMSSPSSVHGKNKTSHDSDAGTLDKELYSDSSVDYPDKSKRTTEKFVTPNIGKTCQFDCEHCRGLMKEAEKAMGEQKPSANRDMVGHNKRKRI